MKLLHCAADLDAGSPQVCVAIGVFDGVHLGHQQVIHETLADARKHGGRAVAVTFDRHPNTVVCPAQAPAMIYPLSKRLEVLARLGLDATLLLRFDLALSRVPAKAFIEDLVRAWPRLYSISVGTNFFFGHHRAGNLTLLRQLGRQLHFVAHGLSAVSVQGRPISSTRIRETISQGRLGLVDQMLGRSYTLVGPVVHGDHLGRTLGFPTVNLDVAGLVIPPAGVYAVQAIVRGKPHPAVLNIGHRPTVKRTDPALRVEAHLLDFDGDLYGQGIEIVFLDKLREEQAFGSLELLKTQISQDIQAARKLLSPRWGR
jgi:riboflavin kinase/FMN adenylyltransferase